MPNTPNEPLLDALLDSWVRINAILVNLLLAITPEALTIRAMGSSPSVSQLFTHMHLAAGRGMDMHYDHPILFLQHMIWHEGYHHGQIKLALKLADQPLNDDEMGPLTWGVWMRKTK